jgi:dephospho-CoA kinase
MLTIGLLGDSERAARRLNELNADRVVAIVEQPEEIAACQLVVGADARADVPLENPEELWHTRIVPFATNLSTGARARRARRARLTEPDPTWPIQAQRLIARLSFAAGDRVIRIDHIGSTSVPGLPAKNLIDIQVVVADMNVANEVARLGPDAGFVRVDGPLLCADRHGMRHPEEVVVDADPGRPTNVNIRAVDNPIWRETLLFRSWLRADPDARADYIALKRGLEETTSDVDEYSKDKIPWIAAAGERAEMWAAQTDWTP